MIEILLLLLLVFAARKGTGRRRKFRRYLRGNIDMTFALLTLAVNDVSLQAVSETVNERTFVSSVIATWALRDFTPGEGPVFVGIAHGDYSSAEIEAFVENTGSWNEGDLTSQEVAKRKIKIVGVFPFDDTGASATAGSQAETLNDGKPIKTKCGWILNTAQTINMWAFNKSGGNLTTGAVIQVEGHANLWPQ